jgi:hypothetical protein
MDGNQYGFEIAIQADPILQSLPLDIESGLDNSGLARPEGSSDSNRDEASGLVLSQIFTNAKITFPLVLAAQNAEINGVWETTWNPPLQLGQKRTAKIAQDKMRIDKYISASLLIVILTIIHVSSR